MAGKKPPPKSALTPKEPVPFAALGDERGYRGLLSGLSTLLEDARRGVARAANSILTTTYWEIGRQIVAFEQGGKARAEYGEALLHRLADDLTAAHGQGFSERNLRQMRTFYRGWEIWQTPSAELRARAKFQLTKLNRRYRSLLCHSIRRQTRPACSRCPGPTMFGFCRSKTPTRDNSTRKKQFAADRPFALKGFPISHDRFRNTNPSTTTP